MELAFSKFTVWALAALVKLNFNHFVFTKILKILSDDSWKSLFCTTMSKTLWKSIFNEVVSVTLFGEVHIGQSSYIVTEMKHLYSALYFSRKIAQQQTDKTDEISSLIYFV